MLYSRVLGSSPIRIHIWIPTSSFHFSRFLWRYKNLLTMERWQNSSFEEKVDLDTIVLSSSDVYSNKGVQKLNSGTGKSLSEALLFSEHGENILCTEIVSGIQKIFVFPRFELGILMYWTCNSMNNLSSHCGLVDGKIRASDKDLTVSKESNLKMILTLLTTQLTIMSKQRK